MNKQARVSLYPHHGKHCITIAGVHHHFSKWPVPYIKGEEDQVKRTIRTLIPATADIEFSTRIAGEDIFTIKESK